MNNLTNSLYEYLLIIQPHSVLAERIFQIKAEFYRKYKIEPITQGKPHITLVNFRQYHSMEERIRQRLRALALPVKPFYIELLDYGSFPSHTIFINIISRSVIQGFVKTLRSEMQGLLKPDQDKKPFFILEPHLTIARRLKPWQYENGWLEYSNKSFSGKFVAKGIVLLRKDEGNTKYTIVEKFEFQDIPVLAKQVTLF